LVFVPLSPGVLAGAFTDEQFGASESHKGRWRRESPIEESKRGAADSWPVVAMAKKRKTAYRICLGAGNIAHLETTGQAEI
jgi:hypothetical protein